jgi:hypothetical protein
MSKWTTPRYQGLTIPESQDQSNRADQSLIGPVLAIVRYPIVTQRGRVWRIEFDTAIPRMPCQNQMAAGAASVHENKAFLTIRLQLHGAI